MRASPAPAAAVLALLGLTCVACSSPPARVPVEVRSQADPARRASIEAALRGDPGAPLDLRFVDLPSSARVSSPPGDVEQALATTRKRYIDADVRRCLEGLAEDAILLDLFRDERRATVERVLFWRVACHVMASESEDAARDAHLFASLGLEVPNNAGAVSPEVEAVIGRALKEVAAAPVASLRVTTPTPGASVSIDGRAPACVTPCVVELRPGVHFVGVKGDGITPEVRRITAPLDAEVALTPTPAPPDLAARQWATRYAGTPLVDSSASVSLLAKSARARQLALLVLDDAESPPRLRGALAVDGVVRARAERPLRGPADTGPEARALLRELVIEGKVIESRSIVKNPLFWVSLAVVTGGAVAVTYALTHKPAPMTEIRF